METKAAYKGTDQNCQCRGYQYGDKWTIRSIHHAKVGQKIGRKVIKSNEQYWFEDGKLKYEVCNG